MRLLVTRPEPDALKLKGRLESRGYKAVVEPLLEASFADAEPIDLDGVTTLIATSRNGLRALRQAGLVDVARDLTVFAVGGATAEEARRMGFRTVVKGPGTATALVPMIASTLDPTEEMLLHLAGERLAVDIAAELSQLGFHVRQARVYAMLPAERLSIATLEGIADGEIDAVLLMSQETAAVYARLIAQHRLGPSARRMVHLCLSEGIARRLQPLGAVPIEIAEHPTLQEMLALVDQTAAKMDDERSTPAP